MSSRSGKYNIFEGAARETIPFDMAVVDEFEYLCRLCATKIGILMGLPIFEAGDHMRNIDKKIAACLPVQVKKKNAVSKLICISTRV